MKYYIGVDLGGTNIAVGIVNEEYKIIGRASVKTNMPRPAEAIAEDIARAIGLAFQIIDDILDATSSLEQLGKNVGVDKDRNKTTFLSFMTIEAANEYARELTDKAKAELSVFNNNEMLCELADYLLTREK